MRILLSIKPEFAEKILNGTKRYEYRKALPRDTRARTVVIYATMPVGKVVGQFDISDFLSCDPDALWEQTQTESGITRAFFDSYFDGRDEASAIAISKPERYKNPKNLSDFIGTSPAPQSFRYIP